MRISNPNTDDYLRFCWTGENEVCFLIGLRRSLLCFTLTARTRQKTSPGLLPINSISPNVPCSVEKLLRIEDFLPFLPFHFKNLKRRKTLTTAKYIYFQRGIKKSLAKKWEK
jgi:hypothetical protein